MVTVVFCIVFPPVPENLAIALSTLDAGPATGHLAASDVADAATNGRYGSRLPYKTYLCHV